MVDGKPTEMTFEPVDELPSRRRYELQRVPFAAQVGSLTETLAVSAPEGMELRSWHVDSNGDIIVCWEESETW